MKFNEYVIDLPNGIRVRTIDEGKGPILLMLHGNPDNADEWKPLIRLLKNDFRCLAPDLPGYGRRGQAHPLPDSFDYSINSQVGFIEALLTHLNIEDKITLVVHDIGGIMGIPWAAQNLDRLDAMIYTNTVAYQNFKWFDTAYRWGNDSSSGRRIAHFSMNVIGWFHGWLFKKMFSIQNPQLISQQIDRFVEDFALNTIAKHTTLCEFRQITKPDFFNGYEQMLKAISKSVPTLTMWGKDDPYVQDHYAHELLAQKTIVTPNIGHWVPLVAADSMAREIQLLCKNK